MANKIPSRGDFEIPESLIDDHEWMCDELIDGPTGQDCELIFPPKLTECDNCLLDPTTGRSSGIYKDGGPIPFDDFRVCPRCNGVGRSEVAVTDDIRLRVYWRPRDWIKIPNVVIEVPENTVQVIGYMTNLTSLIKADRILVNRDLKGIIRWYCKRKGEAAPWGLRQNRYFVQFLERTGGS